MNEPVGMMKELFVIVYFRNGVFEMLSSYCYETKKMAEYSAQGFCDGRFDDDSWSYVVKEIRYYV